MGDLNVEKLATKDISYFGKPEQPLMLGFDILHRTSRLDAIVFQNSNEEWYRIPLTEYGIEL